MPVITTSPESGADEVCGAGPRGTSGSGPEPCGCAIGIGGRGGGIGGSCGGGMSDGGGCKRGAGSSPVSIEKRGSVARDRRPWPAGMCAPGARGESDAPGGTGPPGESVAPAECGMPGESGPPGAGGGTGEYAPAPPAPAGMRG
jgi:hypothetical protein